MANDVFDLNAILDAIDEKPALFSWPIPTIPTGTLVDVGMVDNFVARIPGHVILVLDEAYYESQCTSPHFRDHAFQGTGLLFDKAPACGPAYFLQSANGLAGLRIGYGLGPPECCLLRAPAEIHSQCRRWRQAAAMAAIDDQGHIRRVVTNNADQAACSNRCSIEVRLQSGPNVHQFLYCDLGETPRSSPGGCKTKE